MAEGTREVSANGTAKGGERGRVTITDERSERYSGGSTSTLDTMEDAQRKKDYENSTRRGTQRMRMASDLIVRIPAAQLKKIAEKKKKKLGPYDREAQHFSGVTTMHGPLRVYEGRTWTGWFWVLVMLGCLALLTYQIYVLVDQYCVHPVNSQVSFLIEDSGLEFPLVTVCNFNPIKKTFINQMNATGDFPEELLAYILQANVEMAALYSNANLADLRMGEEAFRRYQSQHQPTLTVDNFFYNGGFECSDIFKICSFGGRKFECCSVAETQLTQLGRCMSLNLGKYGDPWMHKQMAAGEANGLQVILDVRLDQQYTGTRNESDPVFTNSFENGYRFYIHAPDTISYVASEGISVSPGTRVYSSMAANNYVLLNKHEWGQCNEGWPSGYNTTLQYSAGTCALLCKARFYEQICGCTPFMYNVNSSRHICTPLEMYQCMESTIVANTTGDSTEFASADCDVCDVECTKWEYLAYNSYGVGFSDGALRWLYERNPEWTMDHVKENFLAISVFFRDLTYTQYNQQKEASVTSMLSNIGGNMGLCFGMSIITIIEQLIFLLKLFWICISTRRREYMANKKKTEEEKEKHIDATISEYHSRSVYADSNNPKIQSEFDEAIKRAEGKGVFLPHIDDTHTITPPASSLGSLPGSIGSIQKKERPVFQNGAYNNEAFEHTVPVESQLTLTHQAKQIALDP